MGDREERTKVPDRSDQVEIPRYLPADTVRGRSRIHRIIGAAAALCMLACNALFAAGAVPTSTQLPPLRTAKPRPSGTPIRSATPETTAPPTASLSFTPTSESPLTTTALSGAPSATFVASRPLDCRLEWQSPGNEIRYKPGTEFGTGWKLTNTGTSAWDSGSVEFVYYAGAKLHDEALVRLKSSVGPGQSVILSVHMRAPRNPTRYTTYWSLRRGSEFFCQVSLSIYVK